LSYRPTTEFGALTGEVLADLERLRPGLPAESSVEALEHKLGERLRLRLPEIYREYQADAGPPDADAQLQLYQREMEQLLLPRYAALAARQSQREQLAARGRGADVYNRLSYAAIFFVIGLLVVWAPFIPIWDKWIPFLFAALAPLGSPWLPDLQLLLHQRRHALAIGLLQMDLDEAGRVLPLPPVALPVTAALPAASPSARAAAETAKKQHS
jgi:hypothetical protein